MCQQWIISHMLCILRPVVCSIKYGSMQCIHSVCVCMEPESSADDMSGFLEQPKLNCNWLVCDALCCVNINMAWCFRSLLFCNIFGLLPELAFSVSRFFFLPDCAISLLAMWWKHIFKKALYYGTNQFIFVAGSVIKPTAAVKLWAISQLVPWLPMRHTIF